MKLKDNQEITLPLPFPLRFRDLDGLGHVNNAVYPTMLESWRVAWSMNQQIASVQSPEKFPFILARTEIDYLRPVQLVHRQVMVSGWVEKIGQKSFTQGYEIHSQQGELIAKAQCVLVWFDYLKQSSVIIPTEIRSKLEKSLRPA